RSRRALRENKSLHRRNRFASSESRGTDKRSRPPSRCWKVPFRAPRADTSSTQEESPVLRYRAWRPGPSSLPAREREFFWPRLRSPANPAGAPETEGRDRSSFSSQACNLDIPRESTWYGSTHSGYGSTESGQTSTFRNVTSSCGEMVLDPVSGSRSVLARNHPRNLNCEARRFLRGARPGGAGLGAGFGLALRGGRRKLGRPHGS